MIEPVWLTAQQVAIFNGKLVAAFGGLDAGLRDEALLEAAIARAQQKWHYEKPSLYLLAASYAFGIAKAHAFSDGNKRTAYLAAIVFLKLNAVACKPPQTEIVKKMVALANSEINEEGFAAWLEANS